MKALASVLWQLLEAAILAGLLVVGVVVYLAIR